MPTRRNARPSASRSRSGRAARSNSPVEQTGRPTEHERVRSRKSAVLSLRVTFSPARPRPVSRPASVSATRARTFCRPAGSDRSCSSVTSDEMLFAGRAPRMGRESSPRAYSASRRPIPPNQCESCPGDSSARSPTLQIPPATSFFSSTGPTPGRTRTDIGPSRAAASCRPITVNPRGLFCPDAILARSLLVLSPTDMVMPISRSTSPANRASDPAGNRPNRPVVPERSR